MTCRDFSSLTAPPFPTSSNVPSPSYSAGGWLSVLLSARIPLVPSRRSVYFFLSASCGFNKKDTLEAPSNHIQHELIPVSDHDEAMLLAVQKVALFLGSGMDGLKWLCLFWKRNGYYCWTHDTMNEGMNPYFNQVNYEEDYCAISPRKAFGEMCGSGLHNENKGSLWGSIWRNHMMDHLATMITMFATRARLKKLINVSWRESKHTTTIMRWTKSFFCQMNLPIKFTSRDRCRDDGQEEEDVREIPSWSWDDALNEWRAKRKCFLLLKG